MDLDVIYVDQPDKLAALVDEIRSERVLAVDTEFERSRTYFPQLALLQIGWGDHVALIDPLAIDSLRPLADLFVDPDVIKVMHSASEDLEVLTRLFDHEIGGLFDTQRAAGLAGMGPSLSYRRLVEEIAGVEIADDQTRSNWLKRPLSDAQLRYAAEDVTHLPAIYQQLRASLVQLDRLAWLAEDCAVMCTGATELYQPADRLYRIKRAWRLGTEGRRILAGLVAWREERAQKRDLPRNFILDNDALLQLAKDRPTEAGAVGRSIQLSRRNGPRRAAELAAVISELAADSSLFANPVVNEPLPPDDRRILKSMKAVVQRVADQTGIDPTLLGSRKDLTLMLQQRRLPPSLLGWRETLFGAELSALMENS